MRGHGLLLKQTGAPRRLIPHMLLSKSLEGITELVLRSILTIQGAQVQKKPGEKSVTKRTLLWSVICAEFANKTVEEQSRIFLSFYKETTKSSVVPDEIMSKALEHLPFDEVQSDFKGIKDRLEQLDVEQRFKEVLHREKGEKARVEYETPDAIKRLKPSQGVKTVLCMDRRNSAFEAYYPGGRPTRSVSCSWLVEGRDQYSALSFCVQYLWKNQHDKGRAAWPHYIAQEFSAEFGCRSDLHDNQYGQVP